MNARDNHVQNYARVLSAYQAAQRQMRDDEEDDPPPPAERRAAIKEALERSVGADPTGIIADDLPAPTMSPGMRRSLMAAVTNRVGDHATRHEWLSALLDSP
jgi:hypothetical protein